MELLEIYDKVMADYRSECRYLKRFSIEGTQVTGDFLVRHCSYLIPQPATPKTHLYASEVIVLYEQIAYMWTANLIINQMKVATPELYFDSILEERTLISEITMRFKKQIKTETFTGIFKAVPKTHKMGLHWFNTSLQLAEKSQQLECRLVIDVRGLPLDEKKERIP